MPGRSENPSPQVDKAWGFLVSLELSDRDLQELVAKMKAELVRRERVKKPPLGGTETISL